MNPLLTEWLTAYVDARATYEMDAALRSVDQLAPPRPAEMQFTLTSTGLLRDHAGARLGHVSELNPYPHHFAALGINPAALTARQRRTPVPRRNPDTTRLETTTPAEPHVTFAQMAAEARREQASVDAATLPNPAEEAPHAWPEDAIPEDAAPGDVVTNSDNRRVGIVGRNGRNEVIVLRDPNPMHDRLRLPRVHTVPVPDLSNITLAPGPELMARTSDGMASAMASVSAMNASLSAATPPAPPAEFHEGPRMLATLSTETGAAARYAEHTVTTDMAVTRAGQTFHSRGLYATTARRMGEEDTRASYVDRSAAQVGMFMARAYGIEFNDETLTAVTAMTTVFARQASIRASRRAEVAERTAHEERELRDALRDAARTAPVISTADPGPVEAAVAAAKAWKETGISDSVAKLASFKHLLDTLDQLAR